MFGDVTINRAKDKIRIVTSVSKCGASTSISWDWFELNAEHKIIKCPRGYTGEFKGATVLEIESFPPTILFGKEV